MLYDLINSGVSSTIKNYPKTKSGVEHGFYLVPSKNVCIKVKENTVTTLTFPKDKVMVVVETPKTLSEEIKLAVHKARGVLVNNCFLLYSFEDEQYYFCPESQGYTLINAFETTEKVHFLPEGTPLYTKKANAPLTKPLKAYTSDGVLSEYPVGTFQKVTKAKARV